MSTPRKLKIFPEKTEHQPVNVRLVYEALACRHDFNYHYFVGGELVEYVYCERIDKEKT